MIAFGVAIADEERWEQWGARGIARVAEPDSAVLTRRGYESIHEPYNSILEEGGRMSGLEALVLMHEDTEIDDPRFLTKIRNGLALPDVGVLGPIGARSVQSIAWWEGVTCGRVIAPETSLDQFLQTAVPYGWHFVDALDGLMLVLSPWTVRNIRFDARIGAHVHGYDVDYCFEVRARGRHCLVAPLRVVHHTTWKHLATGTWVEACVAWQRKWGGSPVLPRPGALAWT